MPDLLAFIRTELASCHPLRDFSEARPEDHLFDDLHCDSLDRVSLAIALEEKLGVEIPDHVVERWFVIGDVLASLEVCSP